MTNHETYRDDPSRHQKASRAFTNQSPKFDQLNAENKISQYLRDLYRRAVIENSSPGAEILELNCGTGMDAVFFSEHGRRVLATDISDGMILQVKEKLLKLPAGQSIEVLQSSYHDLSKKLDKKFDHIVSNFGGLNCTEDLPAVLKQFSSLLNPNGKVTLMIMPKISPWELLMALKGKFKTAFRRFKKHTPAHIEGVYFPCYYHNPSVVINTLKKDFKLIQLKGVCITVPPEFYMNFVERYPKLFNALCKIDHAIGDRFPFNRIGDHYLITLQKNNV